MLSFSTCMRPQTKQGAETDILSKMTSRRTHSRSRPYLRLPIVTNVERKCGSQADTVGNTGGAETILNAEAQGHMLGHTNSIAADFRGITASQIRICASFL